MKIAVIGQHEWYGSMGTWVADAWEDNGWEVQRVDRHSMQEVAPGSLIQLFVDCSEDFSNGINKIPASSAIKVFWSMDAHMPGGAERSVNIARQCDLVFSSNYEYGVKILEKFGVQSYLLPITYSPRLTKHEIEYIDAEEYGIFEQLVEPQKTFPAVMIGHSNSPQRIELWKRLSKVKDTKYGMAKTANEYIDWMNHAKIVINQPTEPWDMILNNRFFEAMGVGALLLQKRLKTSLIEKMGFREGEHFIYWETLDELFGLIQYYNKNYAKREKIAECGNAFVQRYSIREQCTTMEKIILSQYYEKIK